MSLQKLEVNALTGEETYLELSPNEINNYNAWVKDELAKVTADEAAAEQAATEKAALLAKLGITADEAKLLLG